jgi:hypothetical protein
MANPIKVKIIPSIKHCVAKSSEIAALKGRNNCDTISFLKNLNLKRMYKIIATKRLFKDESFLFQFRKETKIIPMISPKNIQIYTFGQKL